MTDVFISYKREERPRCVAIYNALVDLKLSVWFDGRIEPGTSFDREIEREVEGAKAILVLWSELARNSDWIRNEARTGKQGERLVAARLDDCLPPLEFRSVQTVDLFDAGNFQSGEGWCQIVSRIGRLAGRPGLGDYVRCEQAAEPGLWHDWLAAHGLDPLAIRARERLAALEEQGAQAGPTPSPAQPAPRADAAAVRPTRQPVKQGLPPDPGNEAANKTISDRLPAMLRSPLGLVAVALSTLALLTWVNLMIDPRTTSSAETKSADPATTWKPPVEMDAAEKAAAAAAAVDTTGVLPPAAKDTNNAATPANKVAIADVSRLDCNPGPYIVYFNWDQTSLPPEAAGTLNLAASRWERCGGPVQIDGHTDSSGSASYNVGMSERMAASVRQYLAGRGIPDGVMTTQAFGESRLKVATPDGVRESQNRRVEVTFR